MNAPRSSARTALDVAEMETQNEYLRTENERLTRELAVVSAERSRLQVELALMEGRARENLIAATRIETIVQQTSLGLVSALNVIREERNVERGVRRAQAGEDIEEGQLVFTHPRAQQREQFVEEQASHYEREETAQAPTFSERAPSEGYTGRTESRAPATMAPPRAEPAMDQGLVAAAESIRPTRASIARIDHTLAARDSRLPPPDYSAPAAHDLDDEAARERLARIAENQDYS